MNNRKDLIKPACLLAALIATMLLVSACSGHVSDTDDHAVVTRLDDDGYLYYMDYTKDYYGPEVMNAMREIGYIDPGCSVFFTHNVEGEPITCRNYDFAHRVSEEDRTVTGLNIILHCKPEGKYESIAVADAVWCGENNPLLQQGGPDKKGFDPDLLDILPYQCMDGINEKGLYVSGGRAIRDSERAEMLAVGNSIKEARSDHL